MDERLVSLTSPLSPRVFPMKGYFRLNCFLLTFPVRPVNYLENVIRFWHWLQTSQLKSPSIRGVQTHYLLPLHPRHNATTSLEHTSLEDNGALYPIVQLFSVFTTFLYLLYHFLHVFLQIVIKFSFNFSFPFSLLIFYYIFSPLICFLLSPTCTHVQKIWTFPLLFTLLNLFFPRVKFVMHKLHKLPLHV